MNDCYKDSLPNPDAVPLTNYEVIGILQKKLELCRKTLTEKEYRTLPHIRSMEATLKYALIAHRNGSYRTRESIESKRKFLESVTLRLVERRPDLTGPRATHAGLTSSEVTAMLNLEPKSLSDVIVLFPWFAKYEPLDIEEMVMQFTACGTQLK
ncbi:hypothetical protein XU18_3747 [Perkinsela sp. CCAP 1560/4]|nr:hypothetical protein XU18_3747 [Perkinsela sp. CCAP 1560/4]|eukprot:KNH05184.1 hypothetical protein XU18_3747 [Perkinsela sp. CCAP 1560/4]